MSDVDKLNRAHGQADLLHFEITSSGLIQAVVNSPLAQARLGLQGAQLLHWQPRGHKPVLWVSERAVSAPGQALRGGIPLCWPWFGPREGHSAHGFARTSLWTLQASQVRSDGSVVLELGLRDSPATRAVWDHGFNLSLRCTIAQDLQLTLRTHNSGSDSFSITQALHSYFQVGDIEGTRVLGLQGCQYLDKTRAGAMSEQTGTLSFAAETDRIYQGTREDVVIEDSAWARRIRVAKRGSLSTVVWNPWQARTSQLGDMAADGWRQMLCVETCNAGNDVITLAPGQSHSLSADISVL